MLTHVVYRACSIAATRGQRPVRRWIFSQVSIYNSCDVIRTLLRFWLGLQEYLPDQLPALDYVTPASVSRLRTLSALYNYMYLKIYLLCNNDTVLNILADTWCTFVFLIYLLVKQFSTDQTSRYILYFQNTFICCFRNRALITVS